MCNEATIQDAALQFISLLKDEDKEYVAAGHNDFDMVNQDIRHELKLWHTHPLTRRWREDEASRDIREEIDYSIDHPDNISEEIRKAVVLILNTKEEDER